MFPARFFPDRFFAPRYWAKVGATGEAVTASLVLAAVRIRAAVAGEPGAAPAVAGAPVVNGDV